jgi:hypothetical protein
MKLDHISLLEGANNYAEWSKAMRYTLQGESLWKYIAEGSDRTDIVNFGVTAPTLTSSSSEDDFLKAEVHAAADAKANSAIRRRLAPLVEANIPFSCQNSAHLTWRHLLATYCRSDAGAIFALHARLSSLKMRDVADAPRFLGEFNKA